VAKVGDKPAVTKDQQLVTLANGMQITDSPGLMWPKIEEESRAFRLALAGSIPDTAIDYLTIGLFGGRFFLEKYPELVLALQARGQATRCRGAAHRDRPPSRRASQGRHRRSAQGSRRPRPRVPRRRARPISLEFPPPAEP